MMREEIKALLTILQEELMIYKEVLALAEEKTEVIIKGDVEKLGKITEEEMKLVSKIEEVDAKRQEKLESLKNLGFDAENISQLLELIEGKEAEAITGTRDDMLSVIAKVKERNRLNSELLMQSLEYIDYYINLIVNAFCSSTVTYGKGGISRMESSIFDTKV